ncbi:hypothetical protein [Arthrobacter sp. NA-172]|uniref:hypothetical protein n=1 Tax=Arthrobacter sp. NA-172 TaxID=3367524 RepID=UPI00375460D7
MNQESMDLQVELGYALIESFSDVNWKKINVSYAHIGSFAEATCNYADAQGATHESGMPANSIQILRKLKAATASPEHGAWISADAVLDRETSKIHIKFNYNDKPNWHIDPEPENYLLELGKHPRPQDEVPGWFPIFEDYPNWQDELAK